MFLWDNIIIILIIFAVLFFMVGIYFVGKYFGAMEIIDMMNENELKHIKKQKKKSHLRIIKD